MSVSGALKNPGMCPIDSWKVSFECPNCDWYLVEKLFRCCVSLSRKHAD